MREAIVYAPLALGVVVLIVCAALMVVGWWERRKVRAVSNFDPRPDFQDVHFDWPIWPERDRDAA